MRSSFAKRPSPLHDFKVLEAKRYYFREMYHLQQNGVAGRPLTSIDDNGCLTLHVPVLSRKYPLTTRILFPVTLPGGNALKRFATCWSEEEDMAEGIFIDENGSLFSDWDRPKAGFPVFAAADLVHPDLWPELFATMLLRARQPDLELFDGAHPASCLLPQHPDVPAATEFVHASDVEDIGEDSLMFLDMIERRLKECFAWGDRRFLTACAEPFYTAIAPVDRSMPVRLALNIDEFYEGSPYATFAGDKRGDALAFLALLEKLGYGTAPSPDHGYTQIDLRDGMSVKQRNHWGEVENMGTEMLHALDSNWTKANDPALKEAVQPLYRVFGRGGWHTEEEWLTVWPKVSADIGPITLERVEATPNAGVRLGLRLKAGLDYLYALTAAVASE